MSKRLWISLFCFFACTRIFAIEAVANFNVFFYNDGKSYKPYIELYWQIAPATLHYTEVEQGRFSGKIRTDIVLTGASGTLAEDHYIMQTGSVTSLKESLSQNILEFRKFMVADGKLKIYLRLQETVDTSNVFAFTDSVTIDIPSSKPVYSNIQFLDTSYASTQKSIFLKNGKQQIPLCANFIDNGRNTLFFYTELYNTPTVSKAEAPLVHSIFVSKKPLDNPIYGLYYNDTANGGNPASVHGRLNIEALPSGNYYLNIILKDNTNNKLAVTSQFFQRINTSPVKNKHADTGIQKLSLFNLDETFVSKYTFPQLKAILKMMKPISNSLETETIDNFIRLPEETYIRYFIYNFWKERNPKNPKAAWEEYTTVVKEVNRMYGGAGIAGYETERGIIYLKYGKPIELVSVENEEGSEPYEIWVYSTLPRQSNGGMILFYRPGFMVGEYSVLHSTIRGETRNLDWRSILYKNSQKSSNSNSRAEQYFPGNK